MCEKNEKRYFCETCDYVTSYSRDYTRHLNSKRHRNVNVTDKYKCDICNYITNKKYNYTIHMSSKKHDDNVRKTKLQISKNQCMNCKKTYLYASSLWKHTQKCNTTNIMTYTYEPSKENGKEDDDDSDSEKESTSNSEKDVDSEPDSDSSDSDDSYSGSDNDSSTGSRHKKKSKKHSKRGLALTPELVIELLKQNKELQTMLLEQHRNSAMSQSNNANSFNNTENSHNKTFNIQFFLNEHCKNAIDITEFVRTLDYTTESLASNMRLGYTGGISKMLTDKIKATPVEERPIHCCDEKREKLYIKNNGEWITGNDSKDILQSVIADIANQNYNTFRRWVSENPTCTILDTPAYEKFTMIYKGVIGATTDEEEIKHVKKILSNIIDEIKIEKEKYLR